MKYFIYIVSFLYSMSSFSQTEMDISNDVEAGATDIQNASSFIEANNTIENNAVAIYKSEESILLTDGFFADGGSDVFMAVEKNIETTLDAKNIESSVSNIDFYVYPNPSNGVFTIQSPDPIISYSVSNILGESVTTNTVNDSEFIIDITKFTQGLYLLEIQKENGRVIKKKIIKN